MELGLLKAECPNTCDQFNHKEATEHKTDDIESLLCLMELAVLFFHLTALMFAEVKADEEVGEDTRHIDAHHKQHKIVSKFRVESLLGALTTRLYILCMTWNLKPANVVRWVVFMG